MLKLYKICPSTIFLGINHSLSIITTVSYQHTSSIKMFSKFAALSLLPLAFAAPAPEITAKYIVVMKPGASTASVSPSIMGVTASHNYDIGGFQGFAADLTAAHVETLKSHPNVSLHFNKMFHPP
jgi:hypothetical protein